MSRKAKTTFCFWRASEFVVCWLCRQCSATTPFSPSSKTTFCLCGREKKESWLLRWAPFAINNTKPNISQFIQRFELWCLVVCWLAPSAFRCLQRAALPFNLITIQLKKSLLSAAAAGFAFIEKFSFHSTFQITAAALLHFIYLFINSKINSIQQPAVKPKVKLLDYGRGGKPLKQLHFNWIAHSQRAIQNEMKVCLLRSRRSINS